MIDPAAIELEQIDEHRTRLKVTWAVCSPIGTLLGGASLALGIEACERISGLPVVWASAAFRSNVKPGMVVDFSATIESSGKSVKRARATATVEGEPMFTVNAMLGPVSGPTHGPFVQPPDVPEPMDCPELLPFASDKGSIFRRLEARRAQGRQYLDLDGTPGPASALWIPVPDTSPEVLAMIADIGGSESPQAIGRICNGYSVDNTLRMVERHPSNWVMLDVRPEVITADWIHMSVYLWSLDRRLLAIFQETTAARLWDEQHQRPVR